jgi:Kef-type K+ transport system membrane component KefB
VQPEQIISLFLALASILAVSRLLGAAMQRLGQPAVIGEILGGILVGPTLLHGGVAATLFPASTRPLLAALANLGVALFMFLVGLEMDLGRHEKRGVPVSLSLATTLVPFGLGAALAVHLAGDRSGGHRAAFILFLGAAMAVTAFPVLARILFDRGMHGTVLGTWALASAAICDVLSWSLLAVATTLAGHHRQSAWFVLLAVPYALLVLVVVRPWLRRLLPRIRRNETVLASALTGALLSGAVTEWLGLHFIFGAFLFGLAMPRGRQAAVRADLVRSVGQQTLVLLLPIYFVTAGLRVDLSRLGSSALRELALILLVASGGKVAAAVAAARLSGVDMRGSVVLAVLMNTRGLTEIVILTVGLDLGILRPELYSLMVIMALTTTAVTGPLLSLSYPRHLVERDLAARRPQPEGPARPTGSPHRPGRTV